MSVRDERNGRFMYDLDNDRVCVCGHLLSVHDAHGQTCFAGTNCLNDPIPDGPQCECERFRPSRRKALP